MKGRMVRDPGAEHRCRPPGASWAHQSWKVVNGLRYPPGSVWRCTCGQFWEVSTSRHVLWSDWERIYNLARVDELTAAYEALPPPTPKRRWWRRRVVPVAACTDREELL